MKSVIYTALFAGLLGLGAAAPHTASAATLLMNGSFEEAPTIRGQRGGDFTQLSQSGRSWDIFDALPGWYSNIDEIEIQTNRTLGQIDAADGQYYVELDANRNSRISQDLFLTAGTYDLSFAYSPRMSNAGTNGLGLSLTGRFGTALSESYAGPNGTYQRGEWSFITERFTIAQGGFYVLSFEGQGRSDSLGALLDDVSLAAVPLPAGVILMLSGLAGLVVLRHRRRALA